MLTHSRSKNGIDWIIVMLVIIIMAFGVLNIYSVDADYGIKQIIRIGLGFLMILFFIVITSFSRNFFDIYAFIFYIIGVLSLIGVLFFGKEINGAKAWYSIGGVGIQPVELMKIATGLMIAHVLNIPGNDLQRPKVLFTCLALIAIPGFLILLQPDVGSLFVFGAFLLAMYREGMNPIFLIIPLILAGVFLLSILWNPSLFILGFGILIWIIFTLALIIFGQRNFSFQNMYAIMGVYAGLGVFFLLIMLFINFFGQSFSLIQLFDLRSEIFMSITSFAMAVLSFFTVGIIYLSNLENYRSFRNFNQLKAANSRELILSAVSVLVVMAVVWLVSINAQSLMEKLPKHQQERIMVLFEGEAKYRDTSGYNLLYSKTAIGSGEFFGTGWNKGTVTDGRFVPEQWTDYIFCTVGEEWGFLGSSILVLMYAFLIIRLFQLSENQKKSFSRFFGYCTASILLLHFIVNIGMVLGLFPTVGIPLPFLSYGGSSLWGFMLMIFIFLKLNYENEQSLI
ncbi:MAG: rod shape-determining protein RodA [Flavobacteriaceae bacterium]|nr:rod shape-determining protein RodA [Flavobacteriaceae bacterium]